MQRPHATTRPDSTSGARGRIATTRLLNHDRALRSHVGRSNLPRLGHLENDRRRASQRRVRTTRIDGDRPSRLGPGHRPPSAPVTRPAPPIQVARDERASLTAPPPRRLRRRAVAHPEPVDQQHGRGPHEDRDEREPPGVDRRWFIAGECAGGDAGTRRLAAHRRRHRRRRSHAHDRPSRLGATGQPYTAAPACQRRSRPASAAAANSSRVGRQIPELCVRRPRPRSMRR